MAIPLKYFKWLRNSVILLMVTAPAMGYYYVSSKMERMEQGITDDLKRI
jgi:hypothetical protein